MPLRPNMDVTDILAIFRRRAWFIVFSVLTILFGASVYSVVTPERYKSSTTILVVPQRVPEGYVKSTVSVRIEERLSSIRAQILSRTRLTAVMDELGLYKEERRKVALEDLVEMMRRRIDIQIRRSEGTGDRGNDAFTLSFVHENPQMAMLTAGRLASFFIDENLKTREQQAVGTSEFLDSQLQDTKARLEAQEEKVKQYKLRYMGELPQQVQPNLQVLTRLQEQLKSNSNAARVAEDRKVFIESQIASMEGQIAAIHSQIRALESREPGSEGKEGEVAAMLASRMGGDPLAAELNLKRAQLAAVSAKFTERHPDVVRLKSEIASLERGLMEPATAGPEPGGGSEPAGGVARPLQEYTAKGSEELRRQRVGLKALEAEIASLKKERADILKSIAAVEEKLDRSPKREQEMIGLTRDYENLKIMYDDLLRKKLDADVAQNLEKRQKGEQFQILDPANLPEEPFIPNRKLVFGVALLAALAMGFGGALGLEAMDPTLRGRSDFRHFFSLPVLAAIPAIQDEAYERSRTMRRAALLGGLVSFGLAVAVFLILYGSRVRAIIHKAGWGI